MSELPSASNGYRVTLDYQLSRQNLNEILGGMWDALGPYRDVVDEADAAILALQSRTLQVIGDSITPELDALRQLINDEEARIDDLLGADFVQRLDAAESAVTGNAAAITALIERETSVGTALVTAGSEEEGRAALGLGSAATASLDELSAAGRPSMAQLISTGAI